MIFTTGKNIKNFVSTAKAIKKYGIFKVHEMTILDMTIF